MFKSLKKKLSNLFNSNDDKVVLSYEFENLKLQAKINLQRKKLKSGNLNDKITVEDVIIEMCRIKKTDVNLTDKQKILAYEMILNRYNINVSKEDILRENIKQSKRKQTIKQF